MTDRVVAFRVGEKTFPAIDQVRREAEESWKVFTLKCIAHRFEGTKVAEAIATELGSVAKPEEKVTPEAKPKAKRGKKAKAADAEVVETAAE
jgi:hypothetical protein